MASGPDSPGVIHDRLRCCHSFTEVATIVARLTQLCRQFFTHVIINDEDKSCHVLEKYNKFGNIVRYFKDTSELLDRICAGDYDKKTEEKKKGFKAMTKLLCGRQGPDMVRRFQQLPHDRNVCQEEIIDDLIINRRN